MPIPRVKLNDGHLVPAVAYGTGTAWFNRTGPNGVNSELVDAVKLALKVGYNHVDAAEAYNNAKSTGVALKESGSLSSRESIFVTSKADKGVKDFPATIKRELDDLSLSYLDLFLLHTPTVFDQPGYPSLPEAWKTLEGFKEQGLVKSIGVSNFRVKDLEQFVPSAKIKPAVNQIELHPYVWKEAEAVVEYGNKHGIITEAYGSLSPIIRFAGGPLDPVLDRIGSAHSPALSPSAVLLLWALSKAPIVVTTSSKESRLKEQLELFERYGAGEQLTGEEVKEIDEVGKNGKVQRTFMKHMSE